MTPTDTLITARDKAVATELAAAKRDRWDGSLLVSDSYKAVACPLIPAVKRSDKCLGQK